MLPTRRMRLQREGRTHAELMTEVKNFQGNAFYPSGSWGSLAVPQIIANLRYNPFNWLNVHAWTHDIELLAAGRDAAIRHARRLNPPENWQVDLAYQWLASHPRNVSITRLKHNNVRARNQGFGSFAWDVNIRVGVANPFVQPPGYTPW